MTEAAARRRRPSSGPVVWGSLVLFAALFALFTYRLSMQPAGAERRHVLVRKVVADRVVTTTAPAGPAPHEASTAVSAETEAPLEEPEPEPVVSASS